MAVMDDFKGASIINKIAFIILLVALLCVYIAFTCTGWGEVNTGGHWGLWRACGNADTGSGGCSQLDGWANGITGVIMYNMV